MSLTEQSSDAGSSLQARPSPTNGAPGALPRADSNGHSERAPLRPHESPTVDKIIEGAMKTRELPKANILLVDDRADKLLAVEAILSSLNQNIVTARSGKEA